MKETQIIQTYEFPKNWKPQGSCDIPHKGPIPRTIKETGTKRILDRKILAIENCLGSYGMGGPGFFGLQLEKTKKFPTEWLVLRLWGADNWLHFNDLIIDCHPNQKHKIKTSNMNYIRGNLLPTIGPLPNKAVIDKAVVNLKSCRFEIETGRYFDPNHRFNLEIKEDPNTRPIYAGNGALREFAPKDYVENAWVICKSRWLAV